MPLTMVVDGKYRKVTPKLVLDHFLWRKAKTLLTTENLQAFTTARTPLLNAHKRQRWVIWNSGSFTRICQVAKLYNKYKKDRAELFYSIYVNQ